MTKTADAFRTISEVADELKVPKHVLRFWEGRFPQIRPMKRGGGRRYYRPEDLALLRGICHLLHAEGYTIKGVQKLHKEQGVRRLASAGLAEGASPAVSDEDFQPDAAVDIGAEARDRLSFALADLEAVKARLDSLLKGR